MSGQAVARAAGQQKVCEWRDLRDGPHPLVLALKQEAPVGWRPTSTERKWLYAKSVPFLHTFCDSAWRLRRVLITQAYPAIVPPSYSGPPLKRPAGPRVDPGTHPLLVELVLLIRSAGWPFQAALGYTGMAAQNTHHWLHEGRHPYLPHVDRMFRTFGRRLTLAKMQ